MPTYNPYFFYPPTPQQEELDREIGQMVAEGWRQLVEAMHPRGPNTQFIINFRVFSSIDPDDYHDVDVQLPYTEWELQDAQDKLRLRPGEPCKQRCVYSKEKYLLPHILPDASLPDVNRLALRLQKMDDIDKAALEGLVKMEGTASIPLERLLSMAHSTGDCHIAFGVFDDEALGRFVDENELSAELADVPEHLLNQLDYGKIGRKHRETEQGVYTSQGYVECNTWPELSPAPASEAAQPLEGKSMILHLSLGYFNNPEYDNDHTAVLALPCTEDELEQAIDSVGAASIKECGFSCVDCTVPQLKGPVTDAGTGRLDEVRELAAELVSMERRGSHRMYKALLQAARCTTFDHALRLAENVDAHVLRDMRYAEEYAQDVLAAIHDVDGGSLVSRHVDLFELGNEYMARDNAQLTEYGIILHGEGEPIMAEEQSPGGPAMEMQ